MCQRNRDGSDWASGIRQQKREELDKCCGTWRHVPTQNQIYWPCACGVCILHLHYANSYATWLAIWERNGRGRDAFYLQSKQWMMLVLSTIQIIEHWRDGTESWPNIDSTSAQLPQKKRWCRHSFVTTLMPWKHSRDMLALLIFKISVLSWCTTMCIKT